MATVHIFGDEAGTMPLAETDSPYVSATVSFIGDLPTIDPSKLQRRGLLRQLSDGQGFPFATFIYPDEGFGTRLRRRLSLTDTMARVRRLADGANRQYYPEGGTSPRNLIWIEAMQITLGLAVLQLASRCPITAVHVLLDEKVLPKEGRALLRSQLPKLKSYVDNLCLADPRTAGLCERMRFDSEDVTITWSDEIVNPEETCRVALADAFAGFLLNDLTCSRTRFRGLMTEYGFQECVEDITQIVDRDVRPEVQTKWERDTGLRVPRE